MSSNNIGIAVLRVALGIVFLAHSVYLKAFVFTLPGTAAFFESIGLPAFSAYLVFAIEAVGGLALIAGFKVREFATALGVVALGATWAHFGAGWLFSNQGGGWEYPLFLAVASFAQALMGPGAYALRLPRASVAVAA